MCYAIPGKIVEIRGATATVDYFGERKNALIDIGSPCVGDYVYAPGRPIRWQALRAASETFTCSACVAIPENFS